MNSLTSLEQAQPGSEIIIYQPDTTIKMEVRLENDTVWLTQQQMADLFERDRSVITRHINNIFKEKELDEKSNVHFLHIAQSDKPIKLYSLDVIISVGYRVKSIRGTQFRQWANRILKEYMFRGYSMTRQLLQMENRINHRLSDHDIKIEKLSNQFDFFVRTSLPPREGVFFDGQIFDAYTLMSDLVRSAKSRIILVDNYIDDSVLCMLDKREIGVDAIIFTQSISRVLAVDLERHNSQYSPITIKICRKCHDRFMIIDDMIYHVGASFKDLGKKLFGFSKIEVLSADELLEHLDSN